MKIILVLKKMNIQDCQLNGRLLFAKIFVDNEQRDSGW